MENICFGWYNICVLFKSNQTTQSSIKCYCSSHPALNLNTD